MNVPDLIRAFSARETLPVDVNDVLQCLKQNGNDDSIEFIGVDLEIDILQGAIKVFHVRNGVYAEPERWVNIYYDRGSSIARQRMVCCKELVHLLDPTDAYTQSKSAIEQLSDKIGLPPEMQDPMADGFATSVDRLAEFRATALLMPKAARDLLLTHFRDKKLTIVDVARIADMPTKYVGFAMSEVWESVYELLIADSASNK